MLSKLRQYQLDCHLDLHVVTLTETYAVGTFAKSYSVSNWFRMDGRPISYSTMAVQPDEILSVRGCALICANACWSLMAHVLDDCCCESR